MFPLRIKRGLIVIPSGRRRCTGMWTGAIAMLQRLNVIISDAIALLPISAWLCAASPRIMTGGLIGRRSVRFS